MLVVPALGMGEDATKAFIEPFELEQSTPRRDTQEQEGETTEVRDQKIGLSKGDASNGKMSDEEKREESKEKTGAALQKEGEGRRRLEEK